jgi:hypothetical protein
MKKIVLFTIFLVAFSIGYSQKPGGYASMRVFDANRSVSLGTGFSGSKILIVYEDGTTEEIPLLPYSEKNVIENMKRVNKTINQLREKGYFLITQYTTGEQGNLLSDYTFLKQN